MPAPRRVPRPVPPPGTGRPAGRIRPTAVPARRRRAAGEGPSAASAGRAASRPRAESSFSRRAVTSGRRPRTTLLTNEGHTATSWRATSRWSVSTASRRGPVCSTTGAGRSAEAPAWGTDTAPERTQARSTTVYSALVRPRTATKPPSRTGCSGQWRHSEATAPTQVPHLAVGERVEPFQEAQRRAARLRGGDRLSGTLAQRGAVRVHLPHRGHQGGERQPGSADRLADGVQRRCGTELRVGRVQMGAAPVRTGVEFVGGGGGAGHGRSPSRTRQRVRDVP